MAMKTFNTSDLPHDPRIREPWPENFVEWYLPRDPKLIEELAKILNEAADEKPLQEFYTAHPYLLALAFPCHCCWVFPKPRLGGGKYIPDFLYCDLNSLGYKWTLIELESPAMEATNKDETVSHDCHHAVEQIRDYRRWIRDNALFEEKQGFRGLNADCDGLVVIGRRDGGRTELEQQRLADFRKENIEIASYDRLLYQAKDHLRASKAMATIGGKDYPVDSQ
ncbi:MAG TPA: Shedu anti-phage system protein SduA domain-containing protein [Candidatus Acidoferrum sp.]|nr:Shedu anti-phage system protein SduA domain-containing protein [Candidatus Acidoferrum sp.]